MLSALVASVVLLTGEPIQSTSNDIRSNASECDLVMAIGRDVLNLNEKNALPYRMDARYAACPWAVKGFATPKTDGARWVDFYLSELTDIRAKVRIEIFYGYETQGRSLECSLENIDHRWAVRQPCRKDDVVEQPSLP